jgi:hypothetical protein
MLGWDWISRNALQAYQHVAPIVNYLREKVDIRDELYDMFDGAIHIFNPSLPSDMANTSDTSKIIKRAISVSLQYSAMVVVYETLYKSAHESLFEGSLPGYLLDSAVSLAAWMYFQRLMLQEQTDNVARMSLLYKYTRAENPYNDAHLACGCPSEDHIYAGVMSNINYWTNYLFGRWLTTFGVTKPVGHALIYLNEGRGLTEIRVASGGMCLKHRTEKLVATDPFSLGLGMSFALTSYLANYAIQQGAYMIVARMVNGIVRRDLLTASEVNRPLFEMLINNLVYMCFVFSINWTRVIPGQQHTHRKINVFHQASLISQSILAQSYQLIASPVEPSASDDTERTLSWGEKVRLRIYAGRRSVKKLVKPLAAANAAPVYFGPGRNDPDHVEIWYERIRDFLHNEYFKKTSQLIYGESGESLKTFLTMRTDYRMAVQAFAPPVLAGFEQARAAQTDYWVQTALGILEVAPKGLFQRFISEPSAIVAAQFLTLKRAKITEAVHAALLGVYEATQPVVTEVREPLPAPDTTQTVVVPVVENTPAVVAISAVTAAVAPEDNAVSIIIEDYKSAPEPVSAPIVEARAEGRPVYRPRVVATIPTDHTGRLFTPGIRQRQTVSQPPESQSQPGMQPGSH